MTTAQRQAIHSYDEHLGVDAFLAGIELVPPPDREAARWRRLTSTATTPRSGARAWRRSSASWSASSSRAASCRATTRRSTRTSPTTSPSQDASVNWFEAAQLVVSALAVPLLARLGDLIGARKVLLLSTAVTALGSWILAFAPGFTTFLIGFAIQGAYVVWLPMEVAHRLPAYVGRRPADAPRPAHPPRRRASSSAPSSWP